MTRPSRRIPVTLKSCEGPYLSLHIRRKQFSPMAKGRTKQSDNPRPQGRQNAFTGEKLAFLESYKDQFLESTDRGAFYTMVAKTFLDKFGYALATEEGPTSDDGDIDATGEVDPALQTPEEQERDNEHRNKLYRELRDVSDCVKSERKMAHK
jgi:hypothetical protein